MRSAVSPDRSSRVPAVTPSETVTTAAARCIGPSSQTAAATGSHRAVVAGIVRGGIVAPSGGGRVALKIDCPNCGPRPFTEFTFGGELRDVRSPDAAADFTRV